MIKNVLLKGKFIIFTCLFLAFSKVGLSQQPRFRTEINSFLSSDSVQFPAKNGILFVGSSSLRMWRDISLYFPGYPIINRGFGGSVLPDVINYEKEIITPYQPKQVFVYCGENDVAGGVSADSVCKRFETLFNMIRTDLPDAQISFISMKPAPARLDKLEVMKEGNKKIEAFIKKQKNAAYIDVMTPMLQADGSLRKEIYIEDGIHMNPKGYAIWQKVLAPYLMKNEECN